jgi:hypothetical protein
LFLQMVSFISFHVVIQSPVSAMLIN